MLFERRIDRPGQGLQSFVIAVRFGNLAFERERVPGFPADDLADQVFCGPEEVGGCEPRAVDLLLSLPVDQQKGIAQDERGEWYTIVVEQGFQLQPVRGL